MSSEINLSQIGQASRARTLECFSSRSGLQSSRTHGGEAIGSTGPDFLVPSHQPIDCCTQAPGVFRFRFPDEIGVVGLGHNSEWACVDPATATTVVYANGERIRFLD